MADPPTASITNEATPNAADLRALAVAKLKRAASLPRLQNGRRPRMRDDPGEDADATSEGDKSASASRSGTVAASPSLTSGGLAEREPSPLLNPNPSPSPSPSPTAVVEDPGAMEATTALRFSESPAPAAPTPIEDDDPGGATSGRDTPSSKPKRRGRSRSRSRSRSRTSKDFREAAAKLELGDLSSPEEQLPPIPPISPVLISPRAEHFTAMQINGAPFYVPSPSPHHFLYSPINTPTPAPLPSLDALRAGLIRSNSAHARMMAMNKLTGGRESPVLTQTPSSRPNQPNTLGRSNTVTGVERARAGARMLTRLQKRNMPKEGESDVTSGTEDLVPPSSTISRRKKRKSHTSVSNAAVIDDRDFPVSSSSPSLPSPSSAPFAQREHDIALAKLMGEKNPAPDFHLHTQSPSNHGVVIEENETDEFPTDPSSLSSHRDLDPLHQRLQPPQTVAPSQSPSGPRIPYSSVTSTSSISTTNDVERIPLFLQEEGQKSPYAQDTFPVTISPMGTPSREQDPPTISGGEDFDEGEKVVYPEDIRERKAALDRMESKLSWIGADTGINLNSVPPHTLEQGQDEEEEDEQEEREEEPTRHERPSLDETSTTPLHLDPAPLSSSSTGPSPVPFPETQDVLDSHPSRETSPSVLPETPSSNLTFSQSQSSVDREHPSSAGDTPPARASVASSISGVAASPNPAAAPTQMERSRSVSMTDIDDMQTDREGLTDRESTRREARSKKRESGNTSSKWERMKGTFGRRSRSNSFVRTRNDKTESAASRESNASAKTDASAPQPPQLQTSSSMLSIAASSVPPPRSGVSPVPPISHADLAKYTDPKLMPLPGLVQLEEQRRTRTTQRPSISVPSDNGLSSPLPGTVPNTRHNSPEPDYVTIHRQPSDPRLLDQLRSSDEPYPLPNSPMSQDGRTTPGFFDIPSTPDSMIATSPKATNSLPQTREGALRWLSQHKKIFSSSSSNSNGQGASGYVSDTSTVRKGSGKRKPSLTELLASNANDSGTEREDRQRQIDRANSITPGASSSRRLQDALRKIAPSPLPSPITDSSNGAPRSRPSTPNSIRPLTPKLTNGRSTPAMPLSPPREQQKARIFKHLDALLEPTPQSTDSRSSLGSPPRRLLLSSFVRQIVSPNEVKNRVLLLFNDILVIAKFSHHEKDTTIEPSTLLNRSLVVRNVVELSTVGFQVPSEQGTTTPHFMELSPIKAFVQQFNEGQSEAALVACMDRSKLTKDAPTIANLLFRCAGTLDSRILGAYLARRTNRAVLKSYVDRFGFKGMRIDTALRVFLLAVQLPSSFNESSDSGHVLTIFAARWFEANKGVVTFDRDLAAQLVLAILQLNGILHGPKSTPSRNHINAADFVDAFRAMDVHALVTDDLLQKLYFAVRNDPIIQALDDLEHMEELDASIMISTSTSSGTRTTRLPERLALTARVRSPTITIRLPRPDPDLRIHLYGQDLFFDPPTLDFRHSNEATFVIIGSTLGGREMVLARTGANAARYRGLPITTSVLIERAFMRNTFSISFNSALSGGTSVKRKYRFNVSGEDEYREWRDTMRRQCAVAAIASNSAPLGVSGNENGHGTAPRGTDAIRKAADAVAVQVLRDTVILTDETSRKDGKAFVGHDLVLMCLQNSLIPLVLAFMEMAS